MVSRSIDWDAVQVYGDPKKKEITISFIAVNGFGRFGSLNSAEQNYPGTPASSGIEGPNPAETAPVDIPPSAGTTFPECDGETPPSYCELLP